LERLNGGNEVSFLAQVSLLTDDQHTTIKKGPIERFILSRDIWNQTFKVTIPTLSPHDKVGLTVAQAEAWCLENVFISASDVPRNKPIWLRFTMQVAPPGDLSRVIGDDKISLVNLVEYLSRKANAIGRPLDLITPRSFRLQDLPRIKTPRIIG
jgi:hypothetical protein